MYVAGVFIVMVLDIYHIKRDDTIAVGLARQVDEQVVNATAAITPPDETTMRRAQAIIEAANCVDEFDGELYSIIWQEINVYLGGGTTA